MIVYTATDRAVADYQPARRGLWPVVQHGHRPWDTVENAWRAFHRTGTPSRDRLLLTATVDGDQELSLDNADGYAWPFPEPTR